MRYVLFCLVVLGLGVVAACGDDDQAASGAPTATECPETASACVVGEGEAPAGATNGATVTATLSASATVQAQTATPAGQATSLSTATAENTPSLSPETPAAQTELLIPPPLPDDIPRQGRLLGNPDAPVKLVEYGDYQCPGCAQFTRVVQPLLIEEFIADGQVSFEFRDFAFLGPDSIVAAEAAHCAEEQGKFWEYHDALYYNQGDHKNDGSYSVENLTRMAELAGLDMPAFNDCLASGRHQVSVEASSTEARSIGLPGTPALLLNGELLQGYVTYGDIAELIQAAIDEAALIP
jgi:protein-disulfide isomerase